jgi:hypothetical protein
MITLPTDKNSKLIVRLIEESDAQGLLDAVLASRAEISASCRVAEKSDATLEGILRSRLFHDGAGRDAAVYSLLKSELNL